MPRPVRRHPSRPYGRLHARWLRGATIPSSTAKPRRATARSIDVLRLYTRQMIVQQACKQATARPAHRHGGAEPVEVPVTWDADYEAELWRRVDAFWQCVVDLRPPFSVPPAPPPVVAERIVDMTGHNDWADSRHLAGNYPAKKLAEAAEGALKSLMPDDAAKARAWRRTDTNRAGSLSLRAAHEDVIQNCGQQTLQRSSGPSRQT